MPQAVDAYQSGIEALRSKHYDRAIAHLQRCYELCEQSGDRGSRLYSQAQMGLVKCYRATDQLDQAIVLCRKLSRSPNPSVKSWATRMLSQLTAGDTRLTDAERLYKEGVAAFQRKQYGEAIQHLQQFDRLCQRRQETRSLAYANAQMGLVKCYRATNQLAQAIALCHQLLDIAHPTITPWAQKTLMALEAQLDDSLPSTELIPDSAPAAYPDSAPPTMIISPEGLSGAAPDAPPEDMMFAAEFAAPDAPEMLVADDPEAAWADEDNVSEPVAASYEPVPTVDRVSVLESEFPTEPEALLEAGLTASRQRSYPETITLLTAYLRTYPSERSHHFVQAQMALVRAYLATGQTKAAIAQCRACEHTQDIALKSWVNKTLGELLDPAARAERQSFGADAIASGRYPRGTSTQTVAAVSTYKPTTAQRSRSTKTHPKDPRRARSTVRQSSPASSFTPLLLGCGVLIALALGAYYFLPQMVQGGQETPPVAPPTLPQ